MTSLETPSFPNSVSNSVINYEKIFIEQENIYENLDDKIDYYYKLPRFTIPNNIAEKCIEAFNERGRLNLKFSREATHLVYMFDT